MLDEGFLPPRPPDAGPEKIRPAEVRISPTRASALPVAENLLADEDNERPAADLPSYDDRTMAVLCHVGGYFTVWLVPLILWLSNKDRSRFVADHGKEALNLQLFLTIPYLTGMIEIAILVSLRFRVRRWGEEVLLTIALTSAFICALALFETVVVILASVAAWRGRPYRCPCIFRFIR